VRESRVEIRFLKGERGMETDFRFLEELLRKKKTGLGMRILKKFDDFNA